VRTGINDLILNEMKRLNSLGVKEIVKQTKGDKPFASKPIPPEDLIWALDNLGLQDWQPLIEEFGFDNVNRMVYKIHKMKLRGNYNGG